VIYHNVKTQSIDKAKLPVFVFKYKSYSIRTQAIKIKVNIHNYRINLAPYMISVDPYFHLIISTQRQVITECLGKEMALTNVVNYWRAIDFIVVFYFDIRKVRSYYQVTDR